MRIWTWVEECAWEADPCELRLQQPRSPIHSSGSSRHAGTMQHASDGIHSSPIHSSLIHSSTLHANPGTALALTAPRGQSVIISMHSPLLAGSS